MRSSSSRRSALVEFVAVEIAGQHDERVAEVDRAALGVGDAAVVEDLQQDRGDVGVRLFDLVEQHDASTAGGASVR